MRVSRYFGMGAFEVPTAASGTALPSGALVIQPGHYMPACPYDFSQPGLYQIWTPTEKDPCGVQWSSYRMVIGSDPFALATVAAWANIFGWADYWPYHPANPPDSVLTAKLMGTPNAKPGMLLNLPCGPHAAFVKARAQAAGIQFRYTHLLTAGPSNGYSAGHVSLEMRVGTGPWLLYDPNLCHVYRDSTGAILNLADAVNGFWAGSTVPDQIAPFRFGAGGPLATYTVGTPPVKQGQWSTDAWAMDARLWSPEGLRGEIESVYQVPFLEDAAGIAGYLPAGVTMQQPLPPYYALLSEAAFRARFYGAD